MEKVLENVVSMVEQHPDGIPLKKLAIVYSQTYHKNLTLSSLGFDSITSLVSFLHRDLVLDGDLVLHKDHWRKRKAKAKAKTKAAPVVSEKTTEESERVEEVLEDIVTMIKENPAGIPLKKVSIAYSQKYKHNLTLASMGFKSMSSLVESLGGEVVLKGDMVFPQTHKPLSLQPQSQPASVKTPKPLADSRPETPQSSEHLVSSPRFSSPKGDFRSPHVDLNSPKVDLSYQSGLSFLGPSLVSSSSIQTSQSPPVAPPLTAARPAEILSQSQLYDKIIQVMKKYQLSAPSMEQLQTFYLQMFGEPLPRTQYLSLYDSWEASCPQAPPFKPAPAPQRTGPDTPTVPSTAAQTPLKGPDEGRLQQQPLAASSFLSDSDFPVLGTSVTKENKSKVNDTAQREGSAPVFREAYHAQLREVHRANMRAMEAVEEDEEEVTGFRRRRVLDQDSVNSLMEDVIRDIAADGELVTRERVISKVCQLLQIPSLEAGKIKPWTMPALKDLQYMMREINMFIECMEAVMSICTLYELGRSLAGLKNKKHYEELNLGPLCKLPLVHRMFKIDSNTKDDDIRQIQTVDILKVRSVKPDTRQAVFEPFTLNPDEDEHHVFLASGVLCTQKSV